MKISEDMYKTKILDLLAMIAKELKRFNDREEANLTVIIKEEENESI